ncbi:hypothetical protein ABT104_32125 [Streptomyces mobaraensis]|uniref:hypothetical protein n=1 Tax=Streptomyces mobaraensis TaxID=35621 RepID=UPI003323A83B
MRMCGVVVLAVGTVAAGPFAAEANGPKAHGPEAAVGCVGTNTIEFSPGLGLRARKTRISGTGAYTCVSAAPGFASAKSEISGGGMNGCFASEATTVEKIIWRGGEKSVVVYSLGTVGQVAGQAIVLVAGKVVSGAFRGRTVTSPGTQLTLDLPSCATGRGVRLITGPSTLTIL